MVSRDYSDSESEAEVDEVNHDQPTNVDDDLLMAAEPPTTHLDIAGPSSEKSQQPRSGSATSQGIRIKLRHPKAVKPEDRSSLSPPPPITLKFGVPSRSAKVERAVYSSSEEEGEEEGDGIPPPEPAEQELKRPQKKARKSVNPGSSPKKRTMIPNPAVAAISQAPSSGNQRKSYDWLIPSTAGASHHGPEGRDEHVKKQMRISGWQPGDTPEIDEDLFSESPGGQARLSAAAGVVGAGGSKGAKSAEAKAAAAEARRKSHKKRREGEPPGPGKAWRKGTGVKKGSGKEGVDSPSATTPNQSRPGSAEGTPEPDAIRIPEPRIELIVDDTPFVLADATNLGIPVFSKPIAAPKITLTNFPKVTPYFTPNNGGDSGPFPRREPVRSWKESERTIVGIGGGTLRFKSWTKGPPSELTLILQAEKEAQDAKSKLPKDGSEPKTKAKPVAPGSKPIPILPMPEAEDMGIKTEPSGTSVQDNAESTSTPGSPPPPPPVAKKPRISIKGEGLGTKKTKTKPKPSRPSIQHSLSSDSLVSMSSQGGAGDVEMGEPSATPSATPASNKGPRKSKLAQEIRPEEAELEESP